MRIFRQEVTASTNLDARVGLPGDVFVAEFQTAGRGRLDHKWHSVRGENLTFSTVLSTGDAPAAEVATLPLVVGLALVGAIGRILGGDENGHLALKWPNDVFVDGRKVCGILCERNGGNVIAGVGINVNQTVFPPEISARATSLARQAGHPIDREQVLQMVLDSIQARHRQWLRGGFASLQPDFAEVDYLKGRFISVRQTDADPEPIVGICKGIQKDGTLLVGDVSVFAGEAHVTP